MTAKEIAKANRESQGTGVPTSKDAGAEKPERPICFVIMPITEVEPYPNGHFRRVYDFIIKPACERAGFRPLRADDVIQTNHIVLDVLRLIVEAPMAICDLSSRNPNVLYELGVRQSFNKPVTLVKDDITARIFDIQGLRDIEYDSSLRVDKIEAIVELAAASLRNTHAASGGNGAGEVNSIIQLLGIRAATVKDREVSGDTTLLLEAIRDMSSRLGQLERGLPAQPGRKQSVYHLKSIDRWSLFNAECDVDRVMPDINGTRVVHLVHGPGTLVAIERDTPEAVCRFDNQTVGDKTVLLADLRVRLNDEGKE